MTEREVIIVLEDDFGRVQTTIKTELSAPQLMDKIFELKEGNEQLRQKLKKYEDKEFERTQMRGW